MNFSLFISRRMGTGKKNLTGLVKLIAILSISLGLTVMILAVSVVTGFQSEIRNKVIGFGSHIQLSNYDINFSFEGRPINTNDISADEILEINGVRNIYSFATKPGIIKTDNEIHGVIFKGVDQQYQWDFFNDKLKDGVIEPFSDTIISNDVVISSFVSRLLQLNPGDDIFLYFIQEPPRVRRLTVSAIYETGLEEMDKLFVIGDLRHVQRLNNWEENQVGGVGIFLNDYSFMHPANEMIRDVIPYTLTSRTINQIYPQIFDWLALLDMNVYVIIVIIIVVAGINMITILLISVLEKTNLIGILKALGAANHKVRKIFLYHAGFLILRGILAGNILGIGLALLQQHTGIIKLSQESYFVDTVPINLSIAYVLALNAGTFIICILMLIVPSHIVSRVSPVKAITFR